MRSSLTLKLVSVVLLTSLVGVVLVGLFAYRATASQFDRFLLDEQRVDFVENMQAYYTVNGTWEGVDRWFVSPVRPGLGGGGGRGDNPPGQGGNRNNDPPGQQRRGNDREPPLFLLVDADGLAVMGGGAFRPGDSVPQGAIERGEPIVVDGEAVGTVVFLGGQPQLDPREQAYLQRTNQALIAGALGATVVALLVGGFMAQTVMRPLRELTGAIRAMTPGKLEQAVPVRTQDELGELARAFNEMSAQLATSNQLRQQMTADIAHDLRTPLTVIGGYLEALQDGTLQPTAARFETMHKEVTHLQRLVEDLRTLTLADAGELKLMLHPEAPEDLLVSTAESYKPMATAKGVNLTVQTHAALPKVEVDRERMVQVLGNLLSNALRYTPQGGDVIMSASRDDGFVKLAVADTGVGIPADKLPHIFERSYRVDESRFQQEGESGLGLAIARSIVEAHGGEISAESEVGRGTTIKVAVPLAPPAIG